METGTAGGKPFRGVRGKVASFFIKDDVVNAGATYVDGAVAVDGNIITSRTPDDLPEFCGAIIVTFLSDWRLVTGTAEAAARPEYNKRQENPRPSEPEQPRSAAPFIDAILDAVYTPSARCAPSY